MKKMTSFLFILSILIFSCSQEEEKTITLISEAAQQVNVDVPQTRWKKSVFIAQDAEDTTRSYLDPVVDEVLFNQLSRIPDLLVQKQKNNLTDYAVKRSVRKEEDTWILWVQIEETGTGEVIYENRIENEDPAVFSASLLDETAVSQNMGIAGSQETTAPEKSAESALQLKYINAISLLEVNDYEATNEAVRLFKEILRHDSDFSKAAVGLVHSYLQVIHNDWDKNVAFIQLAQDAALKAVEIDPMSAKSHEALAMVYLLRHKMKEAEKSFLKAIDLNPNLSSSWKGLADVYSHYGLYEAAQKAYEMHLMLASSSKDAILSNALINIGLGYYSKARKDMLRLLTSYPHSDYVYVFIALTHLYENDLSSAAASVKKGFNSNKYNTLAHAVQAMIFARQGDLNKALGVLELEVKPDVGTDASLAVAVAAVYALIGQKGNAVQWLRKAVQWGYHEYLWIKNDPNFNEMRDDLRFKAVLEELKNRWQQQRMAYLKE